MQCEHSYGDEGAGMPILPSNVCDVGDVYVDAPVHGAFQHHHSRIND